MTALAVFIAFVVVALIVGNIEDKRRFKQKYQELDLDYWEEELR